MNAAPDPRQWKALALLCVAFSMVILDARIVILGLPSIEAELDMSADAGHWVMSGCLLSFHSAFAWALVFPAVGLLYAALLLGRRRALRSGVRARGGGRWLSVARAPVDRNGPLDKREARVTAANLDAEFGHVITTAGALA